MNNRWGKQIQPKGSLRSSGQNNINININFNAVKDKANVFAGKKIDNFIQINNQPKTNISRPNVSIETLKQKKKKSVNIKDQFFVQPQLQRKKSKSKLINDLMTPQKKIIQRGPGNSKSIGKKSTKKRSSKSYDNLKKFYGRNSPKDMYYDQEIQKDGLRYKDRYEDVMVSQDNSRSKTNSKSRSKSKSREKSQKKLIKNNSKTKIPTNSTNTRVKNSSHNSKKIQQDQKQKNMLNSQQQVPKKKPSIKKPIQNIGQQSNTNINNPYLKITPNQNITKKSSTQRNPRKKFSQDQTKKIQRTKTPKKKSKQKQSKSLKRLPLFMQNSEQQSNQKKQQYNEQISYTKMQKQAHRLLYDQENSNNFLNNNKKTKKIYEDKEYEQNYHDQRYQNIQSIEQNHQKSRKMTKSKATSYERYLSNHHTLKDIKLLDHHCTIIQKIWRGYKTRSQFINQLNLMNHKIQITRNKIANLDPKFWDDAQSNSILKAEDALSEKNSQIVSNSRSMSQLNSELEKQITEKSYQQQKQSRTKSKKSNNKMKQNRIKQNAVSSQQILFDNSQKQMLQRIEKLQQNLRKEQQKAQQLQFQNKQLKVNLERVNIQNIFNSNYSNNIYNNGNSNGNSQTNLQSMQSSVKSDEQSWEQVKINHGGRNKYKEDPFLEEEHHKNINIKIRNKEKGREQKEQFQLRLPKKVPNIANILTKQSKQKQKQKQKQKKQQHQTRNKKNPQLQKSSQSQSPSISASVSMSNSNQFTQNNPNLKKYKKKIQQNNNMYQCSSPKYSKINNPINNNRIEINTNLLELFNKKQDKLKQTYQKKISIYDRMLNDSIFSPRTYTLKKNQLQESFVRETQVIRCRREEANRVAQYIKQIQKQNPKISQKSKQPSKKPQPTTITTTNTKPTQIHPSSIIKQSNHIIEDFGNINLNSHRSKDHQLSNDSQSQMYTEQQLQQSIQSNKSKDILQNIYKNKVINNNSSISVSNNSISNGSSVDDNINLFNNSNGIIAMGTENTLNNLSLSKQIEIKNNQAIRIFQQISQHHHHKKDQQQQQLQKSLTLTQNKQKSKQLQQYKYQHNNNNNKYKDKKQQSNQSQQQLQQQQNRIQSKPYRGLQTTLLFIKQYCVSFIQYIRNSQTHREQFIDNITIPIQYDTYELLKCYRTTLTNQNQTSYNSHEKQYTYPYFKSVYPRNQVINRQSFNDFNLVYQKLQGECYFTVERQFFLNSLLDAFNQALDYRRPCGIYGQPPIWISQSRTLKNHYLTSQQILKYRQQFLASQKFDQICGVAIAKVIEWSQSLCGFIPQSPQMQNVVIEQQQINHIRQTRIALMLEKDLLENQENMLDFVIQQSQVKLQLGEILLGELVGEFMEEYKRFFIRNR